MPLPHFTLFSAFWHLPMRFGAALIPRRRRRRRRRHHDPHHHHHQYQQRMMTAVLTVTVQSQPIYEPIQQQTFNHNKYK
jgi:hypothetical protein